MIDVIVYYIYSERVYFSLFNDVYISMIGQHLRELLIYINFCHFYFLNSDISLTIYVIEMIFFCVFLRFLLREVCLIVLI